MIKNLRLINDFKKYLTSPTTSSYSSHSREDYMDRCNVSFYEWSNFSLNPKKFTSKKDFLNFLKESHIEYTQYQEDMFRTRFMLYGICKPGKAELLLSGSKIDLEEMFNGHVK